MSYASKKTLTKHREKKLEKCRQKHILRGPKRRGENRGGGPGRWK